MAWTSPETKMDTGQLYVTTDGEHYTPVTEVSINGVEFIPVESPSQRAESERLLKLGEIPLTIDIKLDADWLPMQLDIYNYCVNDVTTATEMLELQERIEAARAEIKRIEHEERKKKISHLAYIFTLLGTNPDLSIEKRKWCCDELAEMYLNGDLNDIFHLWLTRCNGKMFFQRMLEFALEEHGCKVYRARKLSGYPTIVVKPNEAVKEKIKEKTYKRSIFTEADLEDCLKGDLDDFVESLGSYKCSRFWQNVSGPINYGCRLGIDVFPEELKPSKTAEEIDPKAVYISSTETIKENFAYEYLGKSSESPTKPRLKDLYFKYFHEDNGINNNAVCKIKTNNEKETKKMNARKCERCGKLYEVTEWPTTVEAGDENLNRMPVRFKYMELPPEMMDSLNESGLAKQQTSPITISKVLQPSRYESKTESVTLCPHCLNSLKDWFEMKTETITKEAET